MAPEDPLSLTYMKIIKFFLLIVGAWPKKSAFNYWYLRWIIFQTSVVVLGQYLYIVKKFHSLSLFDLCDKFLTLCIAALVLVPENYTIQNVDLSKHVYRVILPVLKRYGVLLQNFVTKFHLSHFKHLGKYNEQMQLPHIIKINDKINKLSNYYTVVMSILMCTNSTFFNLSPMYSNYRHGVTSSYRPENYTVQFAIYFIYPYFDPEDHYYLVSFSNYWFSLGCIVSICVNDILLNLMVFQIIGHIKTLKYDLSQIKKPKTHVVVIRCPKTLKVMNVCVEMFNAQENEEIHSRIVQCVVHHKLIVSFAEEFSSFFGPVLGLNYLFQLFACCLVLLECSQGDPDALARYGPLSVAIFFQLVQISVTFEVVGSESEKIKDSVYDVPWECMDVRNRRSICILLHRSQTPIQITAMGMASVGVQTMAAILKTTFSYYAFLKSMS